MKCPHSSRLELLAYYDTGEANDVESGLGGWDTGLNKQIICLLWLI